MKAIDLDTNIKITDFENFMSVYEDEDHNYRFNLNETIYLDFDKNSLPVYETTSETHWSLISYKLYETIELAWILMKVNNVKAKNMFSVIPPATKIRYLSKDQMSEILEYISKQ